VPLRKEEYYYEEEYQIPVYTKPRVNEEPKVKTKPVKKVKNNKGK